MNTDKMTLAGLADAIARNGYSTTEVVLFEDDYIDVMERANTLFARVRFDDSSVTVSLLDQYHVGYAESRFSGHMSEEAIASFVLALLNP